MRGGNITPASMHPLTMDKINEDENEQFISPERVDLRGGQSVSTPGEFDEAKEEGPN